MAFISMYIYAAFVHSLCYNKKIINLYYIMLHEFTIKIAMSHDPGPNTPCIKLLFFFYFFVL